ncbi:DUF1310 domain-containing protein [Streptococcus suis]|nr:DUF1310 domain-containing protein [Streptococcus suis]
MKKYLGWLIGIIVVLGLIIGEEVKHQMDQQKQLQQEMVKIVKSEEAYKEIEELIKNIDPRAFTNEGVIHSFEMDYDSIKHNPMGGINILILVNKTEDLNISYTLNKDIKTNKFLPGGAVISEKLSDKLQMGVR